MPEPVETKPMPQPLPLGIPQNRPNPTLIDPLANIVERWVMKRQVAGRLLDTRLARATMVNAEVEPGEGEAVAVGKVALEEDTPTTLAEKLPMQPILKQK